MQMIKYYFTLKLKYEILNVNWKYKQYSNHFTSIYKIYLKSIQDLQLIVESALTAEHSNLLLQLIW